MASVNDKKRGSGRTNPARGKGSPAKPKRTSQPTSLPIQTLDILERVSDGFAAFDAEMNYAYVNRKGGELLGRKPEDLIGKNYWVEFPEAKGTPFADAYVRALKTQQPIMLEEHYAPWDRWFENRIYPSKDGLSIFFSDITAHKRAEEKLRESEERFRMALKNSPIIVFNQDRELRYTWIYNPHPGFKGESVLGKTDTELLLAEDAASLTQIKRRVMEAGAAAREEVRTTIGGEEFFYDLTVEPLRDATGRIVGVTCSSMDITERKRAEEKLHTSELRFAMLFEKSAFVVVLSSLPNGVILNVNAALEKAFGFTKEEAVGQTTLDLGINPDAAGRERILAQLQAQGSARDIELELHTKPGEARAYSVNMDLIDIGNEKYILNTMQDITERKRAEEKLRENETRLNSVIENAGGTIWAIDAQRRLTMANTEYFQSTKAALGQELALGDEMPPVFLPPDLRAEWTEKYERALRGENVWEETTIPTVAGGLLHREFALNPIHNAAGKIIGAACFGRDITERKRAEEELRLNRDRLAELSRRLVETRESEARAIGRELHDQFGQILTAMKITLDMAGQLPAEAAAKKIAQAQTLTTDLLDRTSRLSLQLRPPMLDDLGLIPALAWHINRFQEETGIAVEFKHSGVEGVRFTSEIETTAYRVAQESLTNVARHARGTQVKIEAQKRGAEMEIKIEDNGVGFDPQTALALNRGLGGMRERAQLVGGTFEIESAPGRGARKTIRLPWKERA